MSPVWIVPFERVEVLEFTAGEMRVKLQQGGAPPPVSVTYRVACDLVTVTNPKKGESHRYRILGPDRIEGLDDVQPEWTLFLDRVC